MRYHNPRNLRGFTHRQLCQLRADLKARKERLDEQSETAYAAMLLAEQQRAAHRQQFRPTTENHAR